MTIHPDGMKYRVPYTTENRDTLRPNHDHAAYIKGWVDLLEWKEIGLHGEPDNPYSRHYNIHRHHSWKAGVKDAYLFLITDAP